MEVEYPCVVIGVDFLREARAVRSLPTTPCILWEGAVTPKGYGQRTLNGTVIHAHRAAYLQRYGMDSADGLVIDHLCRNHLCVNIEHLEAVPDRVNVARGDGPTAVNARKTHCKRGHKFTPDNIIRNGNGRKCKTCHRMRASNILA